MLASDCREETTSSASASVERRNARRYLTILRVGAMIGPAGRELCLIRNISARGLMAEVCLHHLAGETVAVELKSNQHIAGRVVWAEGTNVGIQFDHAIDVAELLSGQSVVENGLQPRLPRIEVDRLATLRCGARLYGVNTCDISPGGVKIEADEPLEIGAGVVLTLDRFRPVHGVVRWCADAMAGISFNQLLPFGELMDLLRGAKAA